MLSQHVLTFLLVVTAFNGTSSAPRQPENLDILFILHDNGESLQLLPAIELLIALAHRKLVILTLGDPATKLFQNNPNTRPHTRTLLELGVAEDDAFPPNGNEDPTRSTTLSVAAIAQLLKAWPKVRVTVPGMAYRMQAQIATAWKGVNDFHVQCVVDGWGMWDDSWTIGRYFVREVFKLAEQGNGVSAELLVPTKAQYDSVLKAIPGTHVTVVGSPGLHEWRTKVGNVGLVQQVKSELYGDKLGILLAGGYGDGHNASLEVFCEASKLLKDKGYVFALAPHPGPGMQSLTQDRDFFHIHGCSHIFFTSDRNVTTSGGSNIEIDTALASAASSATVSRYSAVSGQSLYIGVPHAFIDGPHKQKDNVFKKYIRVCQNGAALAQWIEEEGSKSFDATLVNELVPFLGVDSSKTIAQRLRIKSVPTREEMIIEQAKSCEDSEFHAAIISVLATLAVVAIAWVCWYYRATRKGSLLNTERTTEMGNRFTHDTSFDVD